MVSKFENRPDEEGKVFAIPVGHGAGKSLERIRQHRLRFCNAAPRPNAASTNKHGIGDFGCREIKGLVEAGDVFRAIIKFLWGFVIEAPGDDPGASFHMDVDVGIVGIDYSAATSRRRRRDLRDTGT